MKLSVIIVSYNVRYFLEVCLHSVFRAASGMAVEVLVVDNNSIDDSVEMVKQKFPAATVLANHENLGFSKANNQAVAMAKGDYVLILNPDTVMPEDFLKKCINYLDAHEDVGSLGPRLIDGKGQFAPDGKKAFPTLSVAIFKTIGLHKLFPTSPYFNKYYAADVGEFETAAVEVLSGCCMFVRKSILEPIGGAFDEQYFMYCEDVDLSYRIQQHGYKNIYFPEATLIHYKGESTRKATISYIRIFNEALATFVKKHYSKGHARLFLLLINIGIMLRAVLGVVKSVLKVLRMPLFDTLVLLATLTAMVAIWVGQVKNQNPVPLTTLYLTFPVYLGLWIGSLYLNGAYDKNYRALRVVRGMLVGTVLSLAYYGLLGPELRYSRFIIVLSGFIGTVALLGLHELLYRLGIFKFIPYDALPRRALIVGNEQAFKNTSAALQKVHYAPAIIGRISTTGLEEGTLGSMENLKDVLYAMGIQEVVFCINGLDYDSVLKQMQHCGSTYDYKIHIPNSPSFVGSNSSHTAGDLYTADTRYNLSSFAEQRNKRSVDILLSLTLLTAAPFLLFYVPNAGQFLSNIVSVLFGKKTWVGYDSATYPTLPILKRAILPPFFQQQGYEVGSMVQRQMVEDYACHYVPGTDVAVVWRNIKFLGN